MVQSDEGELLVEVAGGVMSLTLNRPDALNSLTPEILTRAADVVERVPAELRLVVITGKGRAFSSGAAIGADPYETLDTAAHFVRTLVACEVPVLVAINGLVAGVGMSIALAGDITVAPESAYFLPAFVNIGLVPDGGATELITSAIGRTRATRMMMLGERLPARQAFDAGLITHVVQDAEYEKERDRLITHLAHGPTRAYRKMKRIIADTTLGRLDQTLSAEAAAQRSLIGTADQLEGVRAFQERRKPDFIGQ